MTTRTDALFSDHLMERFKASIKASKQQRAEVVRNVMHAGGLGSGREGTSGAANAYLVFVSNEFGNAAPRWSGGDIDRQGWEDLWRLRIGERNPHFSNDRVVFRNNRRLWSNLYEYLPMAFGDAEVAYAMSAWANLAEGGATASAMSSGMDAIAQYIQLSRARIVCAVKSQVWPHVNRWARRLGGVNIAVDDMVDAQLATVDERRVVAAYVGGHPSHWNQFMSSADFVRRLRALIAVAEKHAR